MKQQSSTCTVERHSQPGDPVLHRPRGQGGRGSRIPFNNDDVDDLVNRLDRAFANDASAVPHHVPEASAMPSAAPEARSEPSAEPEARSEPSAAPEALTVATTAEHPSERITVRAPPDLEVDCRVTVPAPPPVRWGFRVMTAGDPAKPRSEEAGSSASASSAWSPRRPGPPPLPVVPPLEVAPDPAKDLARTRPDLRRMGRALLASDEMRTRAADVAPPSTTSSATMEIVVSPAAPVPPLPTVVITDLSPDTVRPTAPSPRATRPPTPAAAQPDAPAERTSETAVRPAAEVRPVAARPPVEVPPSVPALPAATERPLRSALGDSRKWFLFSLALSMLTMGSVAAVGVLRSSPDSSVPAAASPTPRGTPAPVPAADRMSAAPAEKAAPAPVVEAAAAAEAATAPSGPLPVAAGSAQNGSEPAPSASAAAPAGDRAALGPKAALTARSGRRPPPSRMAMGADASAPQAGGAANRQSPAMSGRIFGDEEEQ